jgi:hypothetical protein
MHHNHPSTAHRAIYSHDHPNRKTQAADHMTEINERPRLANEPFEDEPAFEYPERDNPEADLQAFDQWSRDVQSQLPQLKPYPKP